MAESQDANDRAKSDLAENMVRRWLRPLTRFASYLLDPDLRSDDLDVAEESLALCLRRVATGTWESGHQDRPVDVEQFGRFLFRTVRQLALNRNRKSRCSCETDVGSDVFERIAETRQAGPEIQYELQERSEAVQQAIADLPEDMRVVILLCYFEGHSVAETATILEVPAGTVKSRAARAREILRTKLANWFDKVESREPTLRRRK